MKFLNEQDIVNNKIYLIAEGQVKLECYNNPFRKKENKQKNILQKVEQHKIYDAGSGLISETFNKTNLGIVTQGQWLGEELTLLKGDIPQVYSAIVSTSHAKIYSIDVRDFSSKIPAEIRKELENRAYQKLYKLRDRFKNENEKKKVIERFDHKTANLSNTLNHM